MEIRVPYQLLHGIYQITCVPTGKCYIGSAVELLKRWSDHRTGLCRQDHHNAHLQHAWNKHGEAAFEFSVLELCPVGYLIEREQAYIDARNPEFNICRQAYSTIGITHPIESCIRRGNSRRGKTHTPETRKRIGDLQRGKKRGPLSEEHKQKLRAARLGKYVSPETRQKLREANLGKKNGPPSEATRQKIAEKRRAYWERRKNDL